MTNVVLHLNSPKRHIARAIRRGQKLVRKQVKGSWYERSSDCACAGGMALLALAEEKGIDPAILKRGGTDRLLQFRDSLGTDYKVIINSLVSKNDDHDLSADEIANWLEGQAN